MFLKFYRIFFLIFAVISIFKADKKNHTYELFKGASLVFLIIFYRSGKYF